MNKFKIFATLLWVAISLNAQEVSVFGAGNLNDDRPYGLTENEKALLKNRQKVERLNQNVGDVESRLREVLERLEGLQSVLEGSNRRILKLEGKLADLENTMQSKENNTTYHIESLREYAKKTRSIQDANYKKLTKSLYDLGAMIDANNQKEVAASKPAVKKEDFTAVSLRELMSEAEKLYLAKDYEKAKSRFLYLIEKNHKPARSSFMVGEIEYFTLNYSKAIEFYKKSALLYDKADYMPKLLYHTAISFDKLNQQSQANEFYKALKIGYPDSNEAKASPNR